MNKFESMGFVLDKNIKDSDVCLRIFYSFVVACTIIGLCIHEIYDFWHNIYVHESRNYVMSDVCSKVLIYGTAVMSVLMAIVYRKGISSMLENIIKVDLKMVSSPNIYTKIFWILILFFKHS